MRSKVAEAVRAAQRAEQAQLSPSERVAQMLALGARDVARYADAHGVSLEEARVRLKRGRALGRRPSKVKDA